MGNVVGIAIVWFIIEMLLWYLVAQFISGWWVFLWFIVAAVIGVVLLRKGIASLKPMTAQMQQPMAMLNPSARPPEKKIAQAVAFAVAGILFILPGILSDIVALVVLLPAVQNKAKNYAKDYASKNPEKLMQMVAGRMGGLDPSQMAGMGGMMGGFGNASNRGGQNPFGANSPFGQNMPTGSFGNKGKFGGNTIDGQAKLIKHKKSANDE